MKRKTDLTAFMETLDANKKNITRQQYRTIRGCGLPLATSRGARSTDRAGRRDQAFAGDIKGVEKWLHKRLERRCG